MTGYIQLFTYVRKLCSYTINSRRVYDSINSNLIMITDRLIFISGVRWPLCLLLEPLNLFGYFNISVILFKLALFVVL